MLQVWAEGAIYGYQRGVYDCFSGNPTRDQKEMVRRSWELKQYLEEKERTPADASRRACDKKT
jgi:hypothetical protein